MVFTFEKWWNEEYKCSDMSIECGKEWAEKAWNASKNSTQRLKAEIAAIKSCAEDRRKFTALGDTFILTDLLRQLSAV